MFSTPIPFRWLCLGLAVALHAALLANQPVSTPVMADNGGLPGMSVSLNFALPAPKAAPPAETKKHERTLQPKQAVKPEPLDALTEAPPVTDKPAEAAQIEAQVEEAPMEASSEEEPGLHPILVTSDPLFAHTPTPPRYPTVARKRGQQGVVWVDVWLDNEGRQVDCKLFQSSGYDSLDKAALKAVTRWRFQPYIDKGHRKASIYRIPIEFSLRAS